MNAKPLDRDALRRCLDGTAPACDYAAVGIDNLLSAIDDGLEVRTGGDDMVLRAVRTPLGDRSVEYVMSTEQPVGGAGNVVLQRGWDFADFEQRGRPLLYEHNLDTGINGGLPLGNMSDLRVGRAKGMRALIGVANFTPENLVPFNDMVFSLVRDGWLRGFSVGFRGTRDTVRQPTEAEAGQWGERLTPNSLVFERASLTEGSITPVGLDPSAVKLRTGIDHGIERGAWSRGHAEAFLHSIGASAPQGRSFIPMSNDTAFGAGIPAGTTMNPDSIHASHVYTLTPQEPLGVSNYTGRGEATSPEPPITEARVQELVEERAQAIAREAVEAVRGEMQDHLDAARDQIDVALRTAETAAEQATFAVTILGGTEQRGLPSAADPTKHRADDLNVCDGDLPYLFGTDADPNA